MNGLAASSPHHAALPSLRVRGASLFIALLATALLLLLLFSIGIAPPLTKDVSQSRITVFDIPPPTPDVPIPTPIAPPKIPHQRPDLDRPDEPTAVKSVAHRLDAAPAPPQPVDVTPSLISADDLNRLLTSGSDGSDNGQGRGHDGGAGGNGGSSDNDHKGIALGLARWVTRPTIEDLAPFNPRRAIDEHIVGDVLLACRVRHDRHVRGCRVLAERPRGYDLGSAAIAASHIFRVWPETQGGEAIDDAWVGVPIHYDFATPQS